MIPKTQKKSHNLLWLWLMCNLLLMRIGLRAYSNISQSFVQDLNYWKRKIIQKVILRNKKMTEAKTIEELENEAKSLEESLKSQEPKKRRGRKPLLQSPTGSSENVSPVIEAPPAGRGKPGVEKQIDEIRLGVLAMMTGAGGLVGAFNQFDGSVIQGGAPNMADAIARACRQNAGLRGYMLAFVHASAYGDIAMAAAMIALPIMLNHGLIPMGALGGLGTSFVASGAHNGSETP